MKEENVNKLVEDFPRLFSSLKNGGLQYGLSCGDGWFQLVYDLCKSIDAEIEKASEKDRPDYRVLQIKEKFGGLRFYLTAYTKEMAALIKEGEEKSFKICEVCGQEGALRRGSWAKTLCDDHADGREKMPET